MRHYPDLQAQCYQQDNIILHIILHVQAPSRRYAESDDSSIDWEAAFHD